MECETLGLDYESELRNTYINRSVAKYALEIEGELYASHELVEGILQANPSLLAHPMFLRTRYVCTTKSKRKVLCFELAPVFIDRPLQAPRESEDATANGIDEWYRGCHGTPKKTSYRKLERLPHRVLERAPQVRHKVFHIPARRNAISGPRLRAVYGVRDTPIRLSIW